MVSDARTLALIKQRLDEAERNIQYVKQALEEVTLPAEKGTEQLAPGEATPLANEEERILEGVFDGKNMHGNDGTEYPVPPNYASKSKLVEGDILKLTIGVDGSFVYKQIRPVDRKRIVGKVVVDEQGKFGIEAEGTWYDVLLASVTFYRLQAGDEVTILVPTHGEAKWGALDNVIR